MATDTISFCKLCGKPLKINADGLPAYHAECARIAGVDHGPLFSQKKGKK